MTFLFFGGELEASSFLDSPFYQKTACWSMIEPTFVCCQFQLLTVGRLKNRVPRSTHTPRGCTTMKL